MHPSRLVHFVSFVEAGTWAFLLLSMLTKYVWAPALGDVLVAFAGAAHGAAFLAYLFVVTVIGINARWRPWQYLLGWAASVPPFVTLLFDWWAHSRGWLRAGWLDPELDARHGPLPRRRAGLVRWTTTRPITLAATLAAAFLFILTPALAS